jgi:hypothetical protein
MVGTQSIQKNIVSGGAPKIGMYNALDRACGGGGSVLYLS